MSSCGNGSGDVSLKSFHVILLLESLASSHEVVSFMCTFSLTRGTDGVWGFDLSEPLIDPDDGYCRVVASSKDEVEDNVPKKSVQSVLTHLYPKGLHKTHHGGGPRRSRPYKEAGGDGF